MLALGLSGRKMDVRTAFGLLLALLFGLMLFQARRFVEYFPPFALIFAAFAWAPLLDPRPAFTASPQHRLLAFISLPYFAVTLLFVAVAASIALSVPAAQKSIDTSKSYGLYANASLWLEENTPAGSRVFQTDWDDFPQIFYYNTHNRFLICLDPMFFYEFDPHRSESVTLYREPRTRQVGLMRVYRRDVVCRFARAGADTLPTEDVRPVLAVERMRVTSRIAANLAFSAAMVAANEVTGMKFFEVPEAAAHDLEAHKDLMAARAGSTDFIVDVHTHVCTRPEHYVLGVNTTQRGMWFVDLLDNLGKAMGLPNGTRDMNVENYGELILQEIQKRVVSLAELTSVGRTNASASILPRRSVTSATTFFTSSAFVASAPWAWASPPRAAISALTFSAFSMSRSTTSTTKPPPASRKAMARPIPFAPPVTIATPFTLKSSDF